MTYSLHLNETPIYTTRDVAEAIVAKLKREGYDCLEIGRAPLFDAEGNVSRLSDDYCISIRNEDDRSIVQGWVQSEIYDEIAAQNSPLKRAACP